MIELLGKLPLFHSLNDRQLESVSDVCQVKFYKAETILFHEHEVGAFFYIVISGGVKIYTSNRNCGDEKILAVIGKGEVFGELALLDGKPRSATAQAIEDTQVLSLRANEFTALLKDHFDITLNIVKELCERLRETNEQVRDLTFLDAKERVVKTLVKLATKHGSRSGNRIIIQLKLSYDEISKMAGVPLMLLYQVFKDMQNKEILDLSSHQLSLNLTNLRR
ncbi:MAG: Crp/Fnr family transcriptional regulator [Paenibacillus sp.]|jgi:CRP/FNR family transcriptional regulator/CRP/FNR family cyclic AMP-dependent transcriptional regulator|nr:Crp/Fnr family transcriptional regulator [Paenibacillus sp.]